MAPLHNNQRDGHMRQTINRGETAYEPNTVSNGCPFQAKLKDGGFTSYEERIDAKKIRGRSESFFDHFSQAALFYNSQSEAEQRHIINALRFELGKVTRTDIRERMVGILTQVDRTLAAEVAAGLGLPVPEKPAYPVNHIRPADADIDSYEPRMVKQQVERSPALSMANTVKDTIKSRQVAFLVADGVSGKDVANMKADLEAAGAQVQLIAPKLGMIKADGGTDLEADQSFLTAASVLFDAVYVPAGKASAAVLVKEPAALHFINEAYKHCKAVAVNGEGIDVLKETYLQTESNEPGLLINKSGKDFIDAIALHRFWEREANDSIPA